MKLKRNYKKCLSTAILLCLMASSAYAMPTGGNVVMGNVTNVNNPAAIMAANAHSIIDWNKFNIAANEKVIFNTNTFTVLNRVQGGYESQILGVLQDQGKGHLILMNPSGIVLGENAVIDANKLTLTTLKISNNEFNDLANGRDAVFEINQPNSIHIKSNAKVTINEALNLYGGKINIADGVEIVSKDYGKAGVNMFAADYVEVYSNSANLTAPVKGGSISIGDVQIGSDIAALANLDVRAEHTKINGSDVVVDNQSSHKKKVILLNGNDIEVENATLENRNGDIDIVASDRWRAAVTWDTFTAYPSETNKATVKNTSFKTSDTDVAILGANVDVYGSNISSGKNLIVGAVKEYSNVEGITTAKTYDNSTVNVDDNTQVDVAGTSTVYGAIVNVDWKKFDQTVATTNPLVMWQGRNDISNEEIIEQAKKLKDKEEMQRIINMLQDAGGNVLQQTTDVIAKPVVPSLEDTKNKGEYQPLTGTVTQEDIDSLKTNNKESDYSGVKIPDDFDGTVVVILNEDDLEKSVILEEKDKYINNYGGGIVKETLENKLSELEQQELILNQKLEDKLAKMISETVDEVNVDYNQVIGFKNNDNVPENIVNEFLMAVADKIESSKGYEKYSNNMYKFTGQIMEEMSEVVRGIDDISGDGYFIDFVFSSAYQRNGVVIASVEWTDESGTPHTGQLQWNSHGNPEAYKGLVEFGDKLNELNKDVWKNVVKEFLTASYGDATVSEAVADFAVQLAYSAGKGDTIGKFVKDQGMNVASLTGIKSFKKLTTFIKENFKDGEEFVGLMGDLKDAHKMIEKYKKLSEKDPAKAEVLYDKINESINLLDKTFMNK